MRDPFSAYNMYLDICAYVRMYMSVTLHDGGICQNTEYIDMWARRKKQREQGYSRAEALGLQPQSCR